MDTRDRSIVAQVCLKVAGEVYASVCDVSQGFQPDLFDQIYKHAWKVHDATMKAAAPAPPPPVEDGSPFAPVPVPESVPPTATQYVGPQPAVASLQAVVPLQGPPCPKCNVPMQMDPKYQEKKAKNLNAGKKAPPMWKCPNGYWDPQRKQAVGCQEAAWEEAS